jgi:hypothetical protein
VSRQSEHGANALAFDRLCHQVGSQHYFSSPVSKESFNE